MTCRQCGTDIADKALICYKCGTATTEAKYAPVPLHDGRSRSGLVVLIVLIALAFVGAGLGQTATSDALRMVGWAVALAAVLALIVRVIGGRRTT